jgi:glycosyltransferase involved in cell wall biosynthesis
LKINAVTAGLESPSGWYRIGALKGLLSKEGVDVNQIIPRVSSYPPPEKLKRPGWLLAALGERITYIHKLKGADATILQRELISTLPTIERLLPGKIILDVDDAIFLKKRGLAAKNAAKASKGVICGNNYLADYFSNYNENIRIIPTGVNVSDMVIDKKRIATSAKKIIGWIGTPGNLPFFESITPDLTAFVKERSRDVELRIITSEATAIPKKLRPYCTFVKWYPGIEFEELPKWSVGLMPLADTEWAKGKCSFKMLQYMSAGIPVVVSPVGMNVEVLDRGSFGYAPRSGSEWYSALEALIDNPELNYEFGRQARLVAEKDFSLESVVDKWLDVLASWV